MWSRWQGLAWSCRWAPQPRLLLHLDQTWYLPRTQIFSWEILRRANISMWNFTGGRPSEVGRSWAAPSHAPHSCHQVPIYVYTTSFLPVISRCNFWNISDFWYISEIYPISDIFQKYIRFLRYFRNTSDFWDISEIYKISDFCFQGQNHLPVLTAPPAKPQVQIFFNRVFLAKVQTALS